MSEVQKTEFNKSNNIRFEQNESGLYNESGISADDIDFRTERACKQASESILRLLKRFPIGNNKSDKE